MPTPLLELSTLERPTILIDGREYELMRPDDLGLRDLMRIRRLQSQLAKWQAMDEDALSDEDLDQAAGLLDTLCRMLLPETPAEVYARLSDGHKGQIVQAFTRLARPRATATPAGKQSPTTAG